MTEALDAKAIVVGSPTLNNGLFPTVADFLTYMKGLKPKNRIGAAFGSYGWSGEAVKLIKQQLSEMKFDLMEPHERIQYIPDKEGLESCYAFGESIGEAINEQSSSA
jgi:flavorubredoxin